MFKKRVLTACLLLPITILSILCLSPESFAIVSAFVFLLAAWEWTRLSGFKSLWGRGISLVAMGFMVLLFLSLISLFVGRNISQIKMEPASIVVLGIWCLAGLAVAFYPRGSRFYASRVVGLMMGGFILVPAWISMVALQWANPNYLLYPMILVWSADMGGYFIGKQFGKNKLAYEVSPGKTWEGVLGAFILSLTVTLIGYFLLKPQVLFVKWMLLSLVTVLFAIIGDLFESLFKRLRNIKDSGRLLPGHGGVLDRMDSLLSALPIFAIGLVFLGQLILQE